jgi:hypothetical protein
MKNNIKYIGFHHCYSKNGCFTYTISAVNKMEYVAKVLNEDLNYNLSLISPSWYNSNVNTINVENKYFKNVSKSFNFRIKGKLFNYINIFLSLFWLTFYLLIKTKKSERIIAYHSPWLFLPLLIVKKIKKIQIVLEVEEIYYKVWDLPSLLKKSEIKLLNLADYYIVVNENLKKELSNKDTIVLYGSYWDFTNIKIKKNSEIVKVVYSGVIENINKAAFNLINSMPYLNENVEIHILGYGNDEDIDLLNVMINNINTKYVENRIFFHGLLTGDNFNKFLQTCHIGVNAQKEGNYMNTAFPSKIFTYLSNGLKVVSTNISGIKNSKIADYIVFSNDDSELSIANSINEISVNDNKLNYSEVIKSLHNNFVIDLKKILNDA